MKTSDLIYPVLEIDGPWVSLDEDTLTTTGARVLGWRNDTIIVDSSGRVARIADEKFVSGKGWFWGYSLLLRRIVKVDPVLEEGPRSMPLEEVREKVAREIEAEANRGWREVVRSVREARDIGELMERLLPDYDRRKLIRILRTP